MQTRKQLGLLGLMFLLLTLAGGARAQSQAYTLVQDTNFTALSDVAAPTSALGAIGTTGYLDVFGSHWSISSGRLLPVGSNAHIYNGPAVRPDSEAALNQRVVATTSSTFGTADCYVDARYHSANGYLYQFQANDGSGTHCRLAVANSTGGIASGGTALFTPTASHSYILTLTVVSTSLTSSTLTGTIADATAPATILATSTMTDTTTQLQSAGTMGVAANTNGSAWTDIATYIGISAVNSVPTVLADNYAQVILTGTSTAWLPGTRFTITGGTGASVARQNLNSATQTATLQIYAGTAAGTLTFSDSADTLTTTSSVVADPLAALPANVWPIGGHAGWQGAVTASFTGGMTSQKCFPVKQAATSPRLLYVNSSATPITVTSSVKQGITGALVQVKFGGATSATIPAYGTLISDAVSMTLTLSSAADYSDCLFARTYTTLASAGTLPIGDVTYVNSLSAGVKYIEGVETASSDDTLTAALDNSAGALATSASTNTTFFGPMALLGTPTGPYRAVVVIGDSKTQSQAIDAPGPGSSYSQSGRSWVGELSAQLGFPYLNLALSGDSASNFAVPFATPAYVLRLSLLRLGLDVLNFYGHNDLSGGSVLAPTLETRQVQIGGFIPPTSRYYLTTLTPSTTLNSGAWATATETQQTLTTGSPNIQQYNLDLRGAQSLLTTFSILDFNSVVQTTPTSQKWLPGYTSDGIHQTGGGFYPQFGHGAIAQYTTSSFVPTIAPPIPSAAASTKRRLQ